VAEKTGRGGPGKGSSGAREELLAAGETVWRKTRSDVPMWWYIFGYRKLKILIPVYLSSALL
jgi:hypothetical protein